MASALTVTKDKTADLEKALRALTGQQVFVGIPATENDRKDGESFGNAAIGYINENGSALQNIPPRPHLVPGIKRVQARIARIFAKGGKDALKGDYEAAENALRVAGQVAADSVRSVIREVIPPPLAESTKNARFRKGYKGTTPLIRTGEYYHNITYVLRKE